MIESILTFVIAISLLQPPICSADTEYQFNEFFNAIRLVECYPTGLPCDLNPTYKGNYQISYDYWKQSGINGNWSMVEDDYYARLTMLAYWRRYKAQALKELDFEVLARTHNGGAGYDKISTDIYWQRVQLVMSGYNWWNGERIPYDILTNKKIHY